MRIEFRNLYDKPEFLATVAAWAYNEWWSKKPNNTIEVVADAFRAHLSDKSIPLTLVAEFNTVPVGMISLVDHDIGMEHRTDLWPWVAAVYVVPQYRRCGIGLRLLEAILSEARKFKISKLYLYTVDQESFYISSGWEVLEKEGGKKSYTLFYKIV